MAPAMTTVARTPSYLKAIKDKSLTVNDDARATEARDGGDGAAFWDRQWSWNRVKDANGIPIHPIDRCPSAFLQAGIVDPLWCLSPRQT